MINTSMPLRLPLSRPVFGASLLAVVLLLLLHPAIVRGQELELKNGSVLEGRIVSQSPTSIVIVIAGAEMTIGRDEIVAIRGGQQAAQASAPVMSQEEADALVDRLERVFARFESRQDDPEAVAGMYMALWEAEDMFVARAMRLAAERTLSAEDQRLAVAIQAIAEGHPRHHALLVARSSVRLAAARQAREAGRYDAAAAQLAAARQLFPDALLPRLDAATEAQRRGRPADVVEALGPLAEDSLMAFLSRPAAAVMLLEAHLDLLQHQDAVGLFQMMASHPATAPEVPSLIRRHREELAMAFLTTAGDRFQAGDANEARDLIKRSLFIAQEDPTEEYLQMAVQLVPYMQDEQANEMLRRAIERITPRQRSTPPPQQEAAMPPGEVPADPAAGQQNLPSGYMSAPPAGYN
jgi:tetratricopeptide (TPR) repeat protein